MRARQNTPKCLILEILCRQASAQRIYLLLRRLHSIDRHLNWIMIRVQEEEETILQPHYNFLYIIEFIHQLVVLIWIQSSNSHVLTTFR